MIVLFVLISQRVFPGLFICHCLLILGKHLNTIINILDFEDDLLQVHYERIADFLVCGEGVWFHVDGANNVVFHDGDDEPNRHEEGPEMGHFRNTKLFDEIERVAQCWDRFVADECNIPSIFKNSLTIFKSNGDFDKKIGVLFILCLLKLILIHTVSWKNSR